MGLVVEQDGFVLVEVRGDRAIASRYEKPFDVQGPDMTVVSCRPGEPQYFDLVLLDLSRTFIIRNEGIVSAATPSVISNLLSRHVYGPMGREYGKLGAEYGRRGGRPSFLDSPDGEDKAAKIRELHEHGVGPSAIAAEVGLSRGAVRNYLAKLSPVQRDQEWFEAASLDEVSAALRRGELDQLLGVRMGDATQTDPHVEATVLAAANVEEPSSPSFAPGSPFGI